MIPPSDWPSEIELVDLDGRWVAYRLPRRSLGPWRHLGWLPVLAGVGILSFAVFWCWGFTQGMVRTFGNWGLLGTLFALPAFFAAGGMLTLGAILLGGRVELRTGDGRLIVVEHAGPFRWRRRLLTREIRKFQVHAFDAQNSQRPDSQFATATLDALQPLAALTAELQSGRVRWLVMGYPRHWLKAIADELASSIMSSSDELQEIAVDTVPITRKFGAALQTGEVDRWDAPAKTSIQMQELSDGVTFIVPAEGLWKGSSGLFAFSLFWFGLLGVFSVVLGVSVIDKPAKIVELWPFAFGIAACWAVGVLFLLIAIHLGSRQAVVAVTNGVLKTIESSRLRMKRREWPLEELRTVSVGPSGMEVNNVPVMQLQVLSHASGKVGLLTGRSVEELRWIATHLRGRLPRSTAESDDNSPKFGDEE